MAKRPKITIGCDCGKEHRVDYGDVVACDCGRSWSTAQIPAADYDQILAVDRHFRRLGWLIFLPMALLLLFFLLTNVFTALMFLPAMLLGWFIYGRPIMHRKHRRAIAELTRSWELEPQLPA